MTTTNDLLYIIGYILGFLLAIVIVRAIFSIPKMLKHFKAQTSLLALIAEKNGVEIEKIKKVLEVVDWDAAVQFSEVRV